MEMTAEHKRNLVRGKREANIIKAYLDAINMSQPRGRGTVETLKARLAKVEEGLAEDISSLRRLELTQKKFEITERLSARSAELDMDALEKDFIEVANSYGSRKGIGYNTWRAAGVSPSVLESAGISRNRRV